MSDRASANHRWWIFDLPPRVDPLLVVSILLGVAGIVSVAVAHDDYGWLAFVLMIVSSIPAGLLLVGVVLGTPREYLRGRRSAR